MTTKFYYCRLLVGHRLAIRRKQGFLTPAHPNREIKLVTHWQLWYLWTPLFLVQWNWFQESFISSNFNYCPVAWMFCGKKNLVKLEKLQERALRFVFCDATASYEDLMERGNFLPLSVYRIRCLGIEVFKCFHGLNPAFWMIYLYSPLWNIISGTHVVLNSLNSVPLHTAWDPFGIMARNCGICCLIRWKIPVT